MVGKMRPLTPLVFGAFFAFATAMCVLAGLSLLTAGGPLDAMWRWKPQDYQQVREVGPLAGWGFLLLALVMASACLGMFRPREWGRRLAIAILAVNAAGDAARIVMGAWWEGAIGVSVAAALIWWLIRSPVRALFRS